MSNHAKKLNPGDLDLKGHGNGNKFHISCLNGEILPLATMIADDKEKAKTDSNCIHDVSNNDKARTKAPRCQASGCIAPCSS